ncbi:zinc-dependent alcohol dehydrogenase family protein [Acidocella sp.]|jgi:NADPH:quinone reductase-like Zn-dependent oxidoreductase|uniref:zinc-dependent alcohol dehydrogenase family protein n=1 Tax=Acidocella sp. TaxID=50710 RepID=UPI002F40ED88
MSRIVRFHKTGGPEVLEIENIDLGAPGPGEVKIRVHALGLNRAESMFRSGAYLETPSFPARLGYEAAGEIQAVGSGVQGLSVGDAVSTIPAFSMNQYGVYGDTAIVPAHAVAKHPGNLSWSEAAAIWMQYLTAYGALVDQATITARDAVIIPAASSSVGLAAIQIVNHLGGISIATTRTHAKRAELLKAGAQHVIVTSEQDLAREVMTITSGRGAKVSFDPVAGPTLNDLAAASAEQGTIFLYGALSPEPTPFPLFPALAKNLTLRGYTLFSITKRPDALEKGKKFVLDGLASGALKPIIAKTFPLEQIVEAHRYLESNEQIGKIIVTVS